MKRLVPAVRSRPEILSLLVVASLAAGCEPYLLPPSPPPPPPPPGPGLAIVSGNSQNGTLGELLAEPLAVRVLDPRGAGVAGVAVKWAVVAGAGEFGVSNGVTPTGADGVASIAFRPLAASGPNGVAVTAGADGVDHSPVSFFFHVLAPGVPAEVFIPFGPIFDCTGGLDPSVFPPQPGTIPVGALIVWEYAPWLHPSCVAELRSVTVPPGGTSFDIMIGAGQRYGVILDAAGDWVVRDVRYGGSVTLQVR